MTTVASGRVYAAAEFLEHVPTLFTVSYNVLRIGSVLQSGESLARPHTVFFVSPVPPELANVSDYQARRGAEADFERVRALHYPRAPSRRVALFANLSLADAEQWRGTNTSRQGRPIYTVVPTEEAQLFVASLAFFNYAVRLCKNLIPSTDFRLGGTTMASETEAAAHAYWSGSPSTRFPAKERLEVLIYGGLRVTAGPA